MITENGYSDDDGKLNDEKRIDFLKVMFKLKISSSLNLSYK